MGIRVQVRQLLSGCGKLNSVAAMALLFLFASAAHAQPPVVVGLPSITITQIQSGTTGGPRHR